LDGEDDFEDGLRRGLRGELNDGRYGLPYLGDNQFLLDRLQTIEADHLPETRWYEKLGQDVAGRPRERTTRLTIWIDRADMSKTRSALYAPTELATREPPPSAWTEICSEAPSALR
jgi:CRISPR-associated protein Cas5t